MRRIIFSTALLTALTACAPPQEPGRTGKAPPTRFHSSTERPAKPPRPTAETRQELHNLLAREDYARALELIGRELNRGLAERYLADAYVRAVNGCLQQAESLLTRQEPAQAGRLFAAARDNYPADGALVAQIIQTPEQLAAQIETCAREVMAQGLAAYRADDLDTAIMHWRQILAFAPDHDAARSAIHTTERQLANLRTMEQSVKSR